MEVNENEKIITLLEGKNSTKETFPPPGMVLEQLVKFMDIKNCDFQNSCYQFSKKNKLFKTIFYIPLIL